MKENKEIEENEVNEENEVGEREGRKKVKVQSYRRPAVVCDVDGTVAMRTEGGRMSYLRSPFTPPNPDSHKVGSVTKFKAGCSCSHCVTARRKYKKGMSPRYRERNRQRLEADFNCVIHGSASTYTNYACRCDECSKAMSQYHREKKAAK